jgi:hypothetical protein
VEGRKGWTKEERREIGRKGGGEGEGKKKKAKFKS